MHTYISILRGINVGGHRKILMADLKKMYDQLGFNNIQTYIQSGNVIFETNKKQKREELEELFEENIKKNFGYDVQVIIRTKEEWMRLVEENPFLKEFELENLSVSFLSAVPDIELVKLLLQNNFLPDRISIVGKHAYIYCEGKYHLSPLTNHLIEKKLKLKASARNWKTVLKLHDLILKY